MGVIRNVAGMLASFIHFYIYCLSHISTHTLSHIHTHTHTHKYAHVRTHTLSPFCVLAAGRPASALCKREWWGDDFKHTSGQACGENELSWKHKERNIYLYIMALYHCWFPFPSFAKLINSQRRMHKASKAALVGLPPIVFKNSAKPAQVECEGKVDITIHTYIYKYTYIYTYPSALRCLVIFSSIPISSKPHFVTRSPLLKSNLGHAMQSCRVCCHRSTRVLLIGRRFFPSTIAPQLPLFGFLLSADALPIFQSLFFWELWELLSSQLL